MTNKTDDQVVVDHEVPLYARNLIEHLNEPVLFIVDLEEINSELPFAISEALDGAMFDRLSVVLMSHGGSGSAAFHAAKILRSHVADRGLTILIPGPAASAATLFALVADQLIMAETGYLTGIDVQELQAQMDGTNTLVSSLCMSDGFDTLGELALSFQNAAAAQFQSRSDLATQSVVSLSTDFATAMLAPVFAGVSPEVVGDRKRSRRLALQFGSRLLAASGAVPEERRDALLNHLNSDFAMHGFTVLADEAAEFGLPVTLATDEMASLLSELTFLRDLDHRFVKLERPVGTAR